MLRSISDLLQAVRRTAEGDSGMTLQKMRVSTRIVFQHFFFLFLSILVQFNQRQYMTENPNDFNALHITDTQTYG
jgi:hypothetical protein